MSADAATLQLVNINQSEPRTVILQAGGYAEHRFTGVSIDGRSLPADGPHLTVRLAPGAGARLVLSMKRYANPPTLAFPWDDE